MNYSLLEEAFPKYDNFSTSQYQDANIDAASVSGSEINTNLNNYVEQKQILPILRSNTECDFILNHINSCNYCKNKYMKNTVDETTIILILLAVIVFTFFMNKKN